MLRPSASSPFRTVKRGPYSANYGRVLAGDRTWNVPSGGDIRASRIVCLDPFPVQVEDTTGAGDALRAGILHGMLKG